MRWLAPRDRLRWSIKNQAIRRAPTGTKSSEHQSEVSNASVSAPHDANQPSSLENIHEFEEVCSSISQKEVRTSNTHPEIGNAETWNYHGNWIRQTWEKDRISLVNEPYPNFIRKRRSKSSLTSRSWWRKRWIQPSQLQDKIISWPCKMSFSTGESGKLRGSHFCALSYGYNAIIDFNSPEL